MVKEIVETSIKAQWPRLDLYTWPGNTKAVPVYKKCGFFWEKRDDTTHLMNFIPYVLKTEAVKDYFEVINWYDDSKREIKLEKDGKDENGFEFYEYIWQKDDLNLRMEFERKGRGLRLIETNDYLIKAEIENQKLVFGREYNVVYHVINKSGKDLEVKFNGMDDKNIKFDLNTTVNVIDNEKIEGRIYVDKIDEEQSVWRTHPCASADVYINGKKAEFKLGIEPKYPVKVEMIIPNNPHFIGGEGNAFINLQNNFNEEITLECTLPNNEVIEFKNQQIQVKLQGEERKSIELPFNVRKLGFYNQDTLFNVKVNNEFIEFERKITAPLRGYSGKFYGESDDYWNIFNGEYKVTLDKFDNEIIISNFELSDYSTFVMYPKLGLPYSLEFSKKRPNNVEYFKEDDFIGMKAIYHSDEFKGIKLFNIIKLYSNGLVENYYEIENTLSNSTLKEINLSTNYYSSFADAFIPYDDQLINIKTTDGVNLDYWDSEKIKEKWIFCDNESIKRGICWSENAEIKFNNWYISAEYNLGIIQANKSIRTDSAYISWNAFSDWKSFRRFALKGKEACELKMVDDIKSEVNNGNPFIEGEFVVELNELKKKKLSGTIEVRGSQDSVINEIKELNSSEENKFSFDIVERKELEILTLQGKLNSKDFTNQYAVYYKNNEEILEKIDLVDDKKLYKVNNGLIEIQASPEYSHGLTSAMYKGNEWIENAFPKYAPRGFWNPWIGGSYMIPNGMATSSTIKENMGVDFVEVKDNYNNLWKGIKSSLVVEKDENYKGLTINQYSLMLSGVPVLCMAFEIINNTGKYFNEKSFTKCGYTKVGDKLTDGSFTVEHGNGEVMDYKCGDVENSIMASSLITFNSNLREEKMHVYVCGDNEFEGFTYSEISGYFTDQKLSIKNNNRAVFPLEFTVFGEEKLDKNMLSNLENIKLKL